jgi:thioesterase domain-containing protein
MIIATDGRDVTSPFAAEHGTAIDRLTSILREGIPLTGFMQVAVDHCDAEQLRLIAPYEPNRNHKGAAFGGSLAALAVVTGWSVMELACREEGVDAEVVISHLDMDFLAPVTTTLISHCARPEPEALAAFFDAFMIQGKSRIDLNVIIEGVRANSVKCRATYVALRRLRESEQ